MLFAQTTPILDPVCGDVKCPSTMDRLFQRTVRDARDVPLAREVVTVALVVLPFALLLIADRAAPSWLGLPYVLLLVVRFGGPFTGVLHMRSHHRLFRNDWRVLERVVDYLLAPLFGLGPTLYAAHHVGMHHRESNLDLDASSTLRYRRDSALHFAHYLLRFITLTPLLAAIYHLRRGRPRLHRRVLLGTAWHLSLIAAALAWNARGALLVLVLPAMGGLFLLAAGNWAQHAFIDAEDPGNPYRNSSMCINSRFNRRAWNGGYHTTHHVHPRAHYSDLPLLFAGDVARYRQHRSVVFQGIDFGGVFLGLMLRRHRWLAGRLVELGPPASLDEQAERLRQLSRPIPPSQ